MIFRGVYFDTFIQDLDILISNLGLNQKLLTRLNNLKFIEDRNRRAFGYYLISQVINSNQLWSISDTGKPYYPGIAFNVSHDNRYVVIVAQEDLSDSRKLGVDVANLNQDIQIMEFTDYLTIKELEWINNRKHRFYMIWTLKEATTKGLGDGLGFDFRRLEFNVTEHKTHLEIIGFMDGDKMDWDFNIQFLDEEHLVAIASDQEFKKQEFEIQNASQISQNFHLKMISQEFQVKKVSIKEEWEQAYDIRVKVFVHEQKVPQENELDDLDPECLHWIVVTGDGKAVGTLRLYVDPSGTKGKLGRMAVLKEYRRRGIGKMLIQELVQYAKESTNIQKIVCHSQEYIQNFYKSCGFIVESPEIFMEEGIPHVLMTKVIK